VDETMPPVHVIPGNDGDMVILSRDPIAAATAKQFVEQIVPTPDDVQVIELKHAQAALVKTQLDLLLDHTRSNETSSALNTEPTLKIEADVRTNRLMIQHATTRQMRLINEMVPQLDRPEQENERLVRQQRVYRAQRKRAAEIAEIVKEVYRDLLSSSDKVFAGRDASSPFGYNRAMAATTKSPEYQGLLAVGVDDEGNTLILSAPAYLMEEVMRLVVVVDSNAEGERVVVVPLKSPAARASVGEALKRLLAKPE
jgi:type II secretory pathway component GspD/PulD (secretin)